MEQYSLIEFFSKYVILPMISALATVSWYMFRKQNDKLEKQEQTIDQLKQEVAEIRTELKTEFKYISRDIKEIKDILLKSPK